MSSVAIHVASDSPRPTWPSNATGELNCLYVVDRRIRGEPGLSSAELSTIDAEDRGHEFLEEVARGGRTRELRVTRRVANATGRDVLPVSDRQGAAR